MDIMWRNPHKFEVTCCGDYIMHRTDDSLSDNRPIFVQILEGGGLFYLKISETEIQNIYTLDQEVRFFGPLDSDHTEMLQNLFAGLAGKMG